MIQVVSFDIGGTLIQHGNTPSLVDIISQETGLDTQWVKTKVKACFVENRRSINTFCEEIGYRDSERIARIIHSLSKKRPAYLFDDVRETLDEIKAKGFRLVTLSNKACWNDVCLADYGLDSLFELELYSFHIGVSKPGPEMFRYVEHVMDVQPDNIIHVGDSLTSDVRGANQAGWHSVWIRRNSSIRSDRGPPLHEAKYCVSSLHEIIDIIMRIK
ncbi:HAD family hydrolase [Salmonella enterica subsp. enterica serovar Bovismorbificans]|nr:HAD family hydrolase [Salmonella enterica subsp. enterica serovar Bovismorbificans]